MTDQPKASPVYAALMTLVAVAVLGSFMIWYTDHELDQADQRWCELFIGLDDNYRSAPEGALPERTRKFARQIRDLRNDLNCQKTYVPAPTPATVSPPNR